MKDLITLGQGPNAFGTQNFPYLFPFYIETHYLKIRAKGAIRRFLRPGTIFPKDRLLATVLTYSHMITSSLKRISHGMARVYHNSHPLTSLTVNIARGSL